MVVFIVEDDATMSDCIRLAIKCQFERQPLNDSLEILKFSDAIDAIQALNQTLPDVILLDILLNGPNGFALLNELSSYSDTAQIPVILLSSSDFNCHSLQQYNIRHILQKETMRPEDIGNAVQAATNYSIQEAPNHAA